MLVHSSSELLKYSGFYDLDLNAKSQELTGFLVLFKKSSYDRQNDFYIKMVSLILVNVTFVFVFTNFKITILPNHLISLD